MFRFRTLRRAIARLAAIAILASQFAIPAHACPMQMDATGGAAATEQHQHDMGALCVMHCRDEQQNFGSSTSPSASPAMSACLLLGPHAYTVSLPAVPHQSDILERSTSPPLSILNCCFRV